MEFHQSWDKKVIKLGISTVFLAMVCSFLPNIVLWLAWGVTPTLDGALKSWAAVAAAYGVFYVVQPISTFPVFGTAGTYMGILSGNMTNTRLPASASAQDVVGVEPGSDKGEIVSALGIAGSVVTSTIILTIFILFGNAILSLLPEGLKSALSSLILPALFGALVVEFAAKRPKILIYALPLVLLLKAFSGFPGWLITMVAVFGNLIISRVAYKKGFIK